MLWTYFGVAGVTACALLAYIGYVSERDGDEIGEDWAWLWLGIAMAALFWLPLLALGAIVLVCALPFQTGKLLGDRHERKARREAERRADTIESLRHLRNVFPRDSEAWSQIDEMIKNPEYKP